jgi:hypothetical protein
LQLYQLYSGQHALRRKNVLPYRKKVGLGAALFQFPVRSVLVDIVSCSSKDGGGMHFHGRREELMSARKTAKKLAFRAKLKKTILSIV